MRAVIILPAVRPRFGYARACTHSMCRRRHVGVGTLEFACEIVRSNLCIDYKTVHASIGLEFQPCENVLPFF